MKKEANRGGLIKAIHPRRPDWEYQVMVGDEPLARKLAKPVLFKRGCAKACTTIMTLLPKMTIPGHEGRGYNMINIDGYLST